ncbi:hypothetical protein [Arenimonas oryziterrae]|uniref:Uncharacterized protein n=1 Tax=Arenimonas oryziterrae DSM 21050 = YC6267 TaxID=1121015 RepID=A0A091AUX1_9GAMM|nr:hypothetical protein [Arenimonas oryziterrae]KFN43052.1 hypothetical protein N789_10850 [Arenimonas oryziterrae DSM 21050 = YC6267]
MFKKMAIGFLAVAIACGLAASGYSFGKYLAERDNAGDAKEQARA